MSSTSAGAPPVATPLTEDHVREIECAIGLAEDAIEGRGLRSEHIVSRLREILARVRSEVSGEVVPVDAEMLAQIIQRLEAISKRDGNEGVKEIAAELHGLLSSSPTSKQEGEENG